MKHPAVRRRPDSSSNRRAASFAAGYNSWRAEKVEEKRRRGRLDHLTDARSQPPPVVASSQWHSYPPPILKDSTLQALETNWWGKESSFFVGRGHGCGWDVS
jgi:hypothetical protein